MIAEVSVRRAIAAAAMFALTSATVHGGATFTPLGDLPGGAVYGGAQGVSADGSVVVGVGDSANGTEAFRWTATIGMVGLGDLLGGDFASVAHAVSGDGSVVVGLANGAHEPFRWTATTGMIGLGNLSGQSCCGEAFAVSADGAVVVGVSASQAFRWTADDGMISLSEPGAGPDLGAAYGISADGLVVVGEAYVDSTGWQAFRWTAAGGISGLGDLPGGEFESVAFGASANGRVIVGRGESADGIEAFRWTRVGGMVGLGDMPGAGFESRAYGVSADGSVVVGYGSGEYGYGGDAFIWVQGRGMQRLYDVLVAQGAATALENWDLDGARAVSADGLTIVGWGSTRDAPIADQAWVARLDWSAPPKVVGSAGPDNLFGTPRGEAIDGRGGADVMTGLAGNDIYYVQHRGDVVVEVAGDGTDTIRSSVTYTLPDHVEKLFLTGTAVINGTGNGLNNRIMGTVANNVIDGGSGADRMSGHFGNDAYYVDNSGDKVVEGPDGDTDTVRTTISHRLTENVEKLVLIGDSAINGTGNALNNRITGNGANNTLNGGLGNDTLTGGAGRDKFLFTTALGSNNIDRITDFNPPDDTLRLEHSIFTALRTTGTLAAAAFRVGTAAADADDRILYDPATGNVRYDADGSGATAAVRFATLTTKPALTRADFVAQ